MKKAVSIVLALVILLGVFSVSTIANSSTDTYAPPPNLHELSLAEQLDYFNLVVNRVRNEQPGFVVRQYYPQQMHFGALRVMGDRGTTWYYKTFEEGQDNISWFLSDNANASDLQPEDIISIASSQQGGNWVIEVHVKNTLNPVRGPYSPVARIASIVTREWMAETLVTAAIAPDDITMYYYDIVARATINQHGQVIFSENSYRAHAQFYQGQQTSIATSISFYLAYEHAYFSWYDAVSFQNPWWYALPAWMQWVLRNLFWGFLWMQLR
ncbi:MAG: hypothetical protein FWD06_04275 [Oscillospiraceae bacterium]|nr:hypothetical protein [Oscillospiraceae bacterium]